MIDLTPLEVRKKKGDFRRAMRGYDPALVDDFLDLVADRLEELVRENLTLHERAARQEEQVTDYRDRERALTEALVSAQEMREEVRKQAMREAELATRSAEQHAEQVRARAEEEVRHMRSSAKQEVSQTLSSIRQERQREEEAVRHLRARQQEFLSSYRAFLEQELAELGVIARAAGVTERAANTRQASTRAAASSRATEPDEEPFAPEPFVEDESAAVAEAFEAESEVWAEGEGPTSGVADATDVSGEGSEARLYDAIAGDPDLDGVPGPIGFGGSGSEPWGSTPDWSLPDLQLVDDDDESIDVQVDDDNDEETLILLRNAAAAGYRLEENPPADELLLDDAVVDDQEDPDAPVDDGWLPTLLEDDK